MTEKTFNRQVLLVEDNPVDLDLTLALSAGANSLTRCWSLRWRRSLVMADEMGAG